MTAAAGSTMVPSAVELDWPGGAARALRVGVLLEGTAPGVAERVSQVSELLAPWGLGFAFPGHRRHGGGSCLRPVW